MGEYEDLDAGARTLVRVCGNVQNGERALVVSDQSTRAIGVRVAEAIRSVGGEVEHSTIDGSGMHGEEPPGELADLMGRVDVIFGLTTRSMAHTAARQAATEQGARYLSLPDYSEAVLGGAALMTDFRELTVRADRLASIFTEGSNIRVESEGGTALKSNIRGREGNSAPGWCREPGSLASPPDAEANVALVEDASEGRIVVDGSIPCPEFGLLEEPITLTVSEGRVQRIEGHRAEDLEALFSGLDTTRTRVVAELGVGLNPRARLSGAMLEDEGCVGTIHFGIGSNATIGGLNSVRFHLDHVVRDATLYVDEHLVMKDGVFQGSIF